MRQAFIARLTELMQHDERIVILSADTGFHALDDLRERFPERCLNLGVAEAATIGVAAGLSLSGRQVFVYGIIPFVTMRCFEQIRVDLCQGRRPVTIVGIGGGFAYGPAGPTHHALEDLAIMRSLPGMTVVCPGDSREAAAVVPAAVALTGPCYIRLEKSAESEVHDGALDDFAIGRGIPVRNGKDIAILATGSMLATAEGVCELLAERGIVATLVSMHTVKPLDEPQVRDLASRIRRIVTIEEHSRIGGLGEAVRGALADVRPAPEILSFAVPDEYVHGAGDRVFWRRHYGLERDQIADSLLKNFSMPG